MAKAIIAILTLFLSFLCVVSQHKYYIVFMGHHKGMDSESIINSNHEILASYVGSIQHARSRVGHHYHKSFRGFSAMLTPAEAKNLRTHDSVISVFKSQKYQLLTTRSYDFLLEQAENNGPTKGIFENFRTRPANEVVIGHFDSGIWPEAASFNPSMFGPYPNTFCHWGIDTTKTQGCSNKIIGARYYQDGYVKSYGNLTDVYQSVRDDYGHGTHTISTAAGLDVYYSDEFGQRLLVQKGGAPAARIAVYKVCWHDFCDSSDVLKAFDDAISDNVDIITMSLGPYHCKDLWEDGYSIGSLYAYVSGILTVAAAGNDGYKGPGAVSNIAPWVLTVAATSVDREFCSDVVLGDGQVLKGTGLNSDDFTDQEVVWPNDATQILSDCMPDQLNKYYVLGKIVVCRLGGFNYSETVDFVRDANGTGVIFVNRMKIGRELTISSLPYSIIGLREYEILRNYMTLNYYKGMKSTVSILQTKTSTHTSPAPRMAFFSSRGPNRLNPDIIKPDIAAPGLNIIATFPRTVLPEHVNLSTFPITIYKNDKEFSIMSGTSMSTPHVAGVAAVLKSTYKNWRPGWIKSALMTTATWLDNTGNHILSGDNLATPFDLGSGHLVPDLAFNPGLVYDMEEYDIIRFLCTQMSSSPNGQFYIQQMPKMFNYYCPPLPLPSFDLNYPSIGINGLRWRPFTVKRTLSLVSEEAAGVYEATIHLPNSVSVTVEPPVLDFRQSPRQDYYVTFVHINAYANVYGSIVWSDGNGHNVKTTVALIY